MRHFVTFRINLSRFVSIRSVSCQFVPFLVVVSRSVPTCRDLFSFVLACPRFVCHFLMFLDVLSRILISGVRLKQLPFVVYGEINPLCVVARLRACRCDAVAGVSRVATFRCELFCCTSIRWYWTFLGGSVVYGALCPSELACLRSFGHCCFDVRMSGCLWCCHDVMFRSLLLVFFEIFSPCFFLFLQSDRNPLCTLSDGKLKSRCY